MITMSNDNTPKQIVFHVKDPESLYDELRQIVKNGLEQYLNEMKSLNIIDEILDTKGACEFLNISKPTLHKLRTESGLPSAEINGRIFYVKSDLVNYVKSKQFNSDYD